MSVDPVGGEEVPEALRDARAERLEEYGQYVAVDRIMVGTALAFDEGHPVPVSHVKRFGYEDQKVVRRVASPANARRGLTDEQAESGEEPEPLTKENDDPTAPPVNATGKGRGASTKGS